MRVLDSKMLLKVCGITSIEDARSAIKCGANFLGFNFYEKSPRYIPPSKARAIIAAIEETTNDAICPVGVFVNSATPAEVLAIMQEANVDYAQLHGDESPEFCEEVGAERVIKALRVGDDFDVREVLRYPAFAVLLDALDENKYGGTGRVTNWKKAHEAAGLTRIILAGGLSPDNIAAAIREVGPYAVDVNSGVEFAPGRKDDSKLKKLRAEMNGNT